MSIIGQLWQKESRETLTQAIENATAVFFRRLAGLRPTHCHLHPSQAGQIQSQIIIYLNAQPVTLVVDANRHIQPGQVYICCEEQ